MRIDLTITQLLILSEVRKFPTINFFSWLAAKEEGHIILRG